MKHVASAIGPVLIGITFGAVGVLMLQNRTTDLETIVGWLVALAVVTAVLALSGWVVYRVALARLGDRSLNQWRGLLARIEGEPQSLNDSKFRNEYVWPLIPGVMRVGSAYATFTVALGVALALLTNIVLLATLSVQYLQAERLALQNLKLETQNRLVQRSANVALAEHITKKISVLDSYIQVLNATARGLNARPSGYVRTRREIEDGNRTSALSKETIVPKEEIDEIRYRVYSFIRSDDVDFVEQKLLCDDYPIASLRSVCKLVLNEKVDPVGMYHYGSYATKFLSGKEVIAMLKEGRTMSVEEELRRLWVLATWNGIVRHSSEVVAAWDSNVGQDLIIASIAHGKNSIELADCRVSPEKTREISEKVVFVRKMGKWYDNNRTYILKEIGEMFMDENSRFDGSWKSSFYVGSDDLMIKMLSPDQKNVTLGKLLMSVSKHFRGLREVLLESSAKCAQVRTRMAQWLSELDLVSAGSLDLSSSN